MRPPPAPGSNGSAALRRRLVAELERIGCLTDPVVRQAFQDVPRERFLPEVAEAEGLDAVYANRAIVTRTDARGAPTSSSSEPAIMAIMLERLELAPGLRVLEIGTGTGYNAAVLAAIVGHPGEVTSVELEPDLADRAAAALRAGGHSVRVVVGDGHHGWAAAAPYDRIVVTASSPVVPRAWFDQLVPGGLVELPLHLAGGSHQAVVTFRREPGRLRSVAVVGGAFMSLRHGGPGGAGAGPANVWVSEIVGGASRQLANLSGPGLERLSASARRRLASLMLTSPRARRLGAVPGGQSPSLFLALAPPGPFPVVTQFRPEFRGAGGWAVGTVGRDGRSLALLVGGRGRRPRLEAYGEPEAETALVGLLGRWRAGGCPSADDLVVDVRYWGAGEGHLSTGWAGGPLTSRR